MSPRKRKGLPNDISAPGEKGSPGGHDGEGSRDNDLFVVGIGASAGGLEALRTFVANLPASSRMAYVIAQHLSPQHRSMMVELLGRETHLPVAEATDGCVLESDRIYITPPNRDVFVKQGRLRLREPRSVIGPKPSVDYLFASLAEDQGERAVGVILSGTGSDGAHGVRAIKAAGGISVAQDPESAKYDGMPRAAIASGGVELSLSPEEIARKLSFIANNPRNASIADRIISSPGTMTEILHRIQRRTKLDFSQYREATLGRQIDRRLAALQIAELEGYLAFIEAHPNELDILAKGFLISVTSFFRDKDAFDALTEVIKDLIKRKNPGDHIRIWVPGCATGEEAYTIGIILVEQLGDDLERYQVQIFGTDVDTDAIAHGRKGLYSEPSVGQLEDRILKKYFIQQDRLYRIHPRVRDLVILARQDLTQDPPFVRLDLISCRNVLIYFKNELHDRVFRIFHSALLPGGCLLLGKSESAGQGKRMFEPLNGRLKIFRRKNITLPEPVHFASSMAALTGQVANKGGKAAPTSVPAMVENELLRAYAPASVLINEKYDCLHLFGNTNHYLQLAEGALDFNLFNIIRSELRVELRALLHQAERAQQKIRGGVLKILAGEVERYVRLAVQRLEFNQDKNRLLLVSFEEMDAPISHREPEVVERVEDANIRIIELEHELATTKQHLQTVVEELETANEQLQSLNEELQSSNEELQSSNEELETSNEEMQAANEELTTVNEELQVKTAELQQVNIDLENIQNSISLALVVVDKGLHISRFSPLAAQIFDLRQEMIGQSVLLSLSGQIRIPRLRTKLISVIKGGMHRPEEISEGKRHYLFQILRFLDSVGDIQGAILTLTDVTELRKAEEEIAQLAQMMQSVAKLPLVLFRVDGKGNFTELLGAGLGRLGLRERELLGTNIFEFLPHYRTQLRRALAGETLQFDVEGNASKSNPRDSEPGPWVFHTYLASDKSADKGVIGIALDITENRAAEQQLRLAAAVFDTTNEAIMVTDANLRILMVNPSFTTITGYSAAEAIGKKPGFLSARRHRQEFYRAMWQELSEKGNWQGEIINRRKNGEVYVELLSISAIRGNDGKVERYVGLFTDITERKQREEIIERQANFDSLTGLPNRNLFQDRLSHEVKHALRGGWSLGLMFIDLDNFKWVNDTLGHAAGDMLLKEVARRLESCIRASDTLARLGGDEFMLILPRIDNGQGTELAAVKILAKLAQPFLIEGHEINISGSIGITVFPQDASEVDILIKNADVAMYRAKDRGRNGYQFFTPEMNELVASRLTLGHELRQALKNGEFILHYQPIIALGSGAMAGVEALLRWNHPHRGLMSPVQFIPIAEETGLIIPIGRWVLEQVSSQAQQWRQSLDPELRITVNLSVRQLRNNDFMNFLDNCVQDGRLDYLILEITESVLIEDAVAVVRFLSALRDKGARVSVDDFGSGYSCLGYLRRFPVDYLKINKEFVLGAHSNISDAALVDAVIAMGRGLDIHLVAEGVENAEQLEFLRNHGCEFGQGYFLGKPMPAAEFENFYRLNRRA